MKNIAIVMGGFSEEAHISLKSGENIYKNVDTQKFKPYKVYILPNKWVALDGDKEFPINKSDFSFSNEKETIHFEAVFNIIHGTPGEDGKIQAYFDLIGMPHTSCPFYPAAISFNKRDTNAILEKYGIRVAPSYLLQTNQLIDLDAILEVTRLPCFVKPNKGGSSLGASKVTKKEQLLPAIQKAFKQDDEILIEAFLEGREVSIGVINYPDKPFVTGITEIISDNDFFDYEAKYLGKSKEITPARIEPEVQNTLETLSLKIYELLKIQGLSRTEFILVNNTPYFLEMNTNPGFSDASILPQQLSLANISVKNLITSMLENTLRPFGK